MKRKVIAALLLTAVLISSLVALAVGGSSGDPLISLRYLTDTFLPALTAETETRADQSAEADYQSAQDALDAAYGGFAARAGRLSGDWSYHDLFARTGFQHNDTVCFTPGSGFLFLEGSARAAADGGELVDVTDALSASSMEALTPGHRYLAGENAVVTVTILSEAAYLAPEGYSCSVLSGTEALPFTDLVSTSWYYNDVVYVYEAGLFNGVSETQFSPAASMTRAMLSMVLYRLAGSPAPKGETDLPFTDVPSDSWYAVSVAWASGNGIVNGMGGGLFAPDRNITREQMAVMLYRYAGFTGLPADTKGDLTGFTDAGQCSDWAVDAMSWTVGAGIVGGRTNGSLDPGGTATRAEVSAMLQRFSSLSK